MTAIVRDTSTPGRGLYIEALQRQLDRRGLEVPYLAHDLLAELDGQTSTVASALADGRQRPAGT